MDTLEGMRIFANVARQQSFTRGAQQSGVSTKIASKYVRQLEERLGAQLFNRTTRSVTLTEIGKTYFDDCCPLLDQFDELEGHVQEGQSELAGSIRITAPTAFGSAELIDALVPFQLEHPKVSINLHLSDRNIAVIDEGFDLAIRFGQLEDSSLKARKLLEMRLVVFASPEYLDKHGNPQHPESLATHNCLFRQYGMDQWHFRIDDRLVSVRVNGSFKANSPRAVVRMAAGGLGIGMGPLYVARPYLDSGKLQLLFEAHEASTLNLYAVYPPGRVMTARIRALIDHLVGEFESL